MFERDSYSTSEADDEIDMCVTRDERTILERPVSFIFRTLPGSALQDEDYVPINAVLMFTMNTTRQCARISIETDEIVEDPESFEVSLLSGDAAVRVQTPSVNVEVGDSTPLRAVFQSPEYQVDEGGVVEVCVDMLGPLDRDVQVTLDVDETGKYIIFVTL